ncbi:MAG: hypothetical protein GWO24_35175 [Akkermansiaceae bacterium]|nr:hypothetical protein [Akkermansiaceae bacterium]
MKNQITGLRSELKVLLGKRNKVQIRDPGLKLPWPPGPLDGFTGPVLVDLSKIK